MALPALNNVWCVEFQSGADWYSPANAGQFEQVFAPFSCPRTWLVVHRDDWAALLSAADSGGTGGTTSPQFTTEEVTALKYMAANPSPFNLSVEDGYLVSGSIVGVWVVAWAFRALYLTLRSDGEPTE